MPEKSKIYDKEMITQLRDMEKSIVASTLTEEEKQFAREAEKSSLQFLEGFAGGKIKLADDAYDVMANYLYYLSLSDNPEIAQNLSSASRIYQTYCNARQKKKHLQEVVQSVGEFDIEAVKKGNFSILENKKKREALTSLDLIEMAEAMRNDKTRNMAVRQNQLKNFAQKRIDDILSGQRAPDEGFDRLVRALGSYKQQDAFYKRRDEFALPKNVASSEPVADMPKKEEKVISINEEPAKQNTVVKGPSFKEQNKEKRQVKTKIGDVVKYPTVEQFGILQKKKEAHQLSAAQLLKLSNMLEQVKRAPKKYQFRTDKIEDTLRSYAQSVVIKMSKGEVPFEPEAKDLSVRYCTPQQRNAFSYRMSKPSFSEDKVIIPPSSKKKEAKIIVLPPIEKNKDKTPWYKETWHKIKKIAVAAAVVLLGVATFKAAHSGERKLSDKDDVKQPLTEQTSKVNTENKVASETKVITPQDIQQELQNAKQQIQETAQTKQASKDVKELSKEDQEYAKRTASFLKISTRDNKVAKESDLNKFVESIQDKLPEGVSVERMKYLATFYRLYPDHPFGAKMNKMFNGEEVSVSTEEIAELSQKHGKLGGKYVNSSRTPKVTPDFSR